LTGRGKLEINKKKGVTETGNRDLSGDFAREVQPTRTGGGRVARGSDQYVRRRDD